MAIGAGIHWWTGMMARVVEKKEISCYGIGMYRYHLGDQSDTAFTWNPSRSTW